jgi:hypothetical protein
MVAVPAATPVITPEVALTVATEVLEEVQLPPPTVELNVVVFPVHTFWSPESVPALSVVETVTVLVAVALEHPPVPVTV